jgi:DNA-binding NtrC family response regulator
MKQGIKNPRKTILIVDNAYSTLLLLKEEFEGAGYEVLTTDSGEEALEILNNSSKPVNLVITNLRHAGPHTLDFIWLFKRNWPDLPVICLTALSEYKGLPPPDRPFDDLVEKSSDLTKLKNSVVKLIGKEYQKLGESSPLA